MAQTRARISCNTDCVALQPMMELRFSDVWTDSGQAVPAADDNRLYADLRTPAPLGGDCLTDWDSACRSLIQYVQHIQPLWNLPRQVLDTDGVTVRCDHRHGLADMFGRDAVHDDAVANLEAMDRHVGRDDKRTATKTHHCCLERCQRSQRRAQEQ